MYTLKRGHGGIEFRHWIGEGLISEEDMIIEKLKDPTVQYVALPETHDEIATGHRHNYPE